MTGRSSINAPGTAKRGRRWLGTSTGFAERPPGARSSSELPAQSTVAAVIQRPVDRLVTQMPIRPVGLFIA